MKTAPINTDRNSQAYSAFYDRFEKLHEAEKATLPKTAAARISGKVAGVAVGTCGMAISLCAVGLGFYIGNPLLIYSGVLIGAGAIEGADRLYAPQKYCHSDASRKLANQLGLGFVENETLWEKTQRSFGFGKNAALVRNRIHDFNQMLQNIENPDFQQCFQPKSDLFQIIGNKIPLINKAIDNFPKTPPLQEQAVENQKVNTVEVSQAEDEKTSLRSPATTNKTIPTNSPQNPTLIGRLIDMVRSTFGMSR
jgi:hypothetical protein